MSLKVYNDKRDFKKTREPKGQPKKSSPKGKNKSLSFVIQEHHASHLHYDFRLELDGVLKSWAVPKGPSFDPHDKRLAVEVEDHPFDYGSFTGTIPEGEYGAGEVYIWDYGTWDPIGEPRAALKKGRLEFNMKGQKMHGTWILVRTRASSSGKHQWLLIKRTDAAGASKVVFKPLTDREKKAKPATKIKTKTNAVNSAKKTTRPKKAQTLPEFIELQMALLVDNPPQGDSWAHELKFDGYRIESLLDFKAKGAKRVELKTRNNNDWTQQFSPIADALKSLPVTNAILDGEVVTLERSGRSDFQLLQSAIKENRSGELIYEIFDILFLNGQDLRDLPLRERKDLLKELLKKAKDPLRYVDDLDVSGTDLLRASCQLELEGIISKQTDSTYASNRNGTWTKSKCKMRQEFVVGGYTDTQGGRAGFGAMLLGVYDNKKFRYVGKVGTGFTEKTLATTYQKLKALKQADSPFDEKSPQGRGFNWIQPKLVAEVEFGNWTKEQILRIPVFQGFRADKKPRDVKIENPRRVETLAKIDSVRADEPTKPSRLSAKLPTLSSESKIIYKKEKITKGMMAAYYQAVAPYLLPAILNRPLSVLRCPNGSTGTCFFQKHDPNDVEHLQPISITEKKGTKDYISVNSNAGLQALVQMGTIEIHPWNCRNPHIEYPDQIVMDFDPGEKVPWKKIVAAAFEFKAILDELKLKSFVKVTGGKGLHIQIPIATVYSWDQIKDFSHTLATELASRNPEFYTTDMSKKIRDHKIFLDYLRNGRGATAAAPYTLRAKPISAVAMPIEWEELRKLPAANFFTMKEALLKIKKRKKDPWADYQKTAQKISILKEA